MLLMCVDTRIKCDVAGQLFVLYIRILSHFMLPCVAPLGTLLIRINAWREAGQLHSFSQLDQKHMKASVSRLYFLIHTRQPNSRMMKWKGLAEP
jgi:hypothetical protein